MNIRLETKVNKELLRLCFALVSFCGLGCFLSLEKTKT